MKDQLLIKRAEAINDAEFYAAQSVKARIRVEVIDELLADIEEKEKEQTPNEEAPQL